MRENHIDYQGQIQRALHESDRSEHDLIDRKQLVDTLWGTGLTLSLDTGRKIHFLSVVRPDAVLCIQLQITDVDSRQTVGFVNTIIQPLGAKRLDKQYTEAATPEVKRKGVITTATALLFHVLQERGIGKVFGSIYLPNPDSIYTRLRVPDLIQGGFYRNVSEFKFDRKQRPFLSLVSFIGDTYPRLSSPMEFPHYTLS